MSDSSPTPSRPSSAAGGASSSPSRPPIISRPSALSVRPQLGIQTRIRARSVGAGSGSSLPTSANLHLSPTLAGSPVLPGVESFLGGELMRDSPLARHEPVLAIGRRGSGGLSSGDEDDEEDAAGERTPGMEDGTGSTESDSPPSTPAHGSAAGAGVGSHSIPAFRVTKGDWRGQGLGLGEVQRNNRTMLEGSTRHNLRRGRSFTSLLIQPTTPPVERPDPIKEVHSPPLSDIESGGDDTTSSSYPPTTLPVPPRVEGPPKTIRDFLPQVAILLGLFLSSFAVIAALIATLPGLFLPHSVADLPTLTSSLSTYRASSTLAELHLFAVLTVLFLWKQCFSIPGSVLTNILFGALYGTAMGTWWACVWTALGSTGAYGIALILSPLVEHYFRTPLDVTRRALKLPDPDAPPSSTTIQPLSSGDLFSHLLLARFFPLLPYSVLNVISGVLRLPLTPFFLTLIIGSFPFNFVTVSIGSVVALAASDPSTPLSNKIWSSETLTKLAAVTIVSVVPLVFKKQLQAFLSDPRVGAVVVAIPNQVGYWVDRGKNALVRKVFGFGIVSSGNHGRSVSAPASSTGGLGRRKGEWRRKWNQSWGGDGFRFERTLGGTEVQRSVMGRWEGDEGDGVMLLEAEEGDELA